MFMDFILELKRARRAGFITDCNTADPAPLLDPQQQESQSVRIHQLAQLMAETYLRIASPETLPDENGGLK